MGKKSPFFHLSKEQFVIEFGRNDTAKGQQCFSHSHQQIHYRYTFSSSPCVSQLQYLLYQVQLNFYSKHVSPLSSGLENIQRDQHLRLLTPHGVSCQIRQKSSFSFVFALEFDSIKFKSYNFEYLPRDYKHVLRSQSFW